MEILIDLARGVIGEHWVAIGVGGVILVIAIALAVLIPTVLVVSLVVIGLRRRRDFTARTEREGIVLDTGVVRMRVLRSRRWTSAPNRLTLTPHALALVHSLERIENAGFHRVQAWIEGRTLKLRIAPDPASRRVGLDVVEVDVAEPGRWTAALAARGAHVSATAPRA